MKEQLSGYGVSDDRIMIPDVSVIDLGERTSIISGSIYMNLEQYMKCSGMTGQERFLLIF